MFLGTLREAEVERINERISQAVMETCLAMTIFREEFNIEFVAMFTALTFIKVFHWLVQDRVDYLETMPSIARLSHLRILTFMGLLLVRSALLRDAFRLSSGAAAATGGSTRATRCQLAGRYELCHSSLLCHEGALRSIHACLRKCGHSDSSVPFADLDMAGIAG